MQYNALTHKKIFPLAIKPFCIDPSRYRPALNEFIRPNNLLSVTDKFTHEFYSWTTCQ